MNYHWNWGIFWELSPDASGTYLETLFKGLGWVGFATMLTFIGALLVALVYVWKKGALEWD